MNLPGGVFDSFRLDDADDAMHLVRARSFAEGQSWFDFTVLRLGQDTNLYWSRLPDAVLAGAAFVFHFFVSQARAFELAALFVPLLLCALLITLAQAMTRPFAGRGPSRLAGLWVFLCAHPLLFEFKPTRVDHHAYTLLLGGLGFVGLTRLIVRPRAVTPAFILAASCAVGLWIGMEALPFVLLDAAALAFFAVFYGGLWQRRAALFGALFGLFCAVLLPAAQPASLWASHAVSWFSGTTVLFALLLGAVFVFFDKRAPRRFVARAGLFAALACLSAALFFTLVPEALSGPYADFEAASAKIVLGHVGETHAFASLFARQMHRPLAFLLLFAPLSVPVLSLFFVAQATGRRRILWLPAFFSLAFLVGAVVWQVRLLPAAQLFALPGLTYGLARLPRPSRSCLAAVLCLWIGFAPVVFSGRPFFPDGVFFYAAETPRPCDASRVAKILGDPATFGATSHTVVAVADDGPALLYFTPHSVLAAPYNVDTNKDVLSFFSARREGEAQKIAAEHGFDWVLVCHMIPRVYTGGGPTLPRMEADGQGHIQLVPGAETLIERLARGNPPAWLAPVSGFTDKDYSLFAVAH